MAQPINGRKLTTHEVTIQTVAVTIQAMRVGPKQVTLALFRQLPFQQLVTPDTFELRGVPWGWVEYFWDGCNPVNPHGIGWTEQKGVRHIVWQRNDTLYRSLCYKDVRHMVSRERERQIDKVHEMWGSVSLFDKPRHPNELSRLIWDLIGPWQVLWNEQWNALNDLPQLFIAV